MALAILSLFIIYNSFDKNKINYVSVTDYYTFKSNNYNSLVYNYLKDNNRLSSFSMEFTNQSINSIYKDLLDNRTIRVNNNDYYFKKVLRESDIVVIDVGMNELSNNYDKYNMDNNKELYLRIYSDIEKLIKEIRKYAKGNVLFIGPYNPSIFYEADTDSFFNNIDITLGELMKENNIIYIDTYELVKSKGNIQDKLSKIIEFYME